MLTFYACEGVTPYAVVYWLQDGVAVCRTVCYDEEDVSLARIKHHTQHKDKVMLITKSEGVA